jgi:hypothetical protein
MKHVDNGAGRRDDVSKQIIPTCRIAYSALVIPLESLVSLQFNFYLVKFSEKT